MYVSSIVKVAWTTSMMQNDGQVFQGHAGALGGQEVNKYISKTTCVTL